MEIKNDNAIKREKSKVGTAFEGVLTFLEKLGELAEKGEQLSKTMSFEGKTRISKGYMVFP